MFQLIMAIFREVVNKGKWLWLIILWMCRYKAEIHVLNQLHDKCLKLGVDYFYLFGTCIVSLYLHMCHIKS
jgi:hypothetical protein